MNETTTTILILAVACAALAWILCAQTRRVASDYARIMAAAAESNRQFMAYSEKAVNRVMARESPQTYRAMRDASGLVEGAQAPVEGHYEKPAARAKAPAASNGIASSQDVNRRIGTALDFEHDGDAR